VATDPERELFASTVLSVVGRQAARLVASEITGFLAVAGQVYDRGLMVVGRAVNGWTEGITPVDLCKPEEVDRYARLVQESVSGDVECPMRWVTAGWGAMEGYITKRSAFWRSIRSVVQNLGIADVQGAGWSSNLVWSNLYKMSPAGGGNPSNVLCEFQFRGCADLLNLELRTYRPSRVLFLTGVDWAAPFLAEAEPRGGAGFHYVKQFGLCGDARCVIAVHPQGKPGAAWAREVVTAFDR
jgi:hypothetical protein